MSHEVAFHVEDEAVVCSCGEYLAAGSLSLAAWANHLRAVNGINLADAYEAGWHDHYLEWERQKADPSYAIGWGKRVRYPAPECHGDDRTTTTPTTPATAATEGDSA